jgi:hypothetical protein
LMSDNGSAMLAADVNGRSELTHFRSYKIDPGGCGMDGKEWSYLMVVWVRFG